MQRVTRRSLLMTAASALLAPAAMAAPVPIVYPRPESAGDARSLYPNRLLEMALARVDRDYKVLQSPLRMQQGRALLSLQDRNGIDVVAYMTSVEREANLLPIRIPIDKGLVGWRLLLVNRSQAARFRNISTIDDLKPFRAGQGADWPDYDILRANGLDVFGTSSYEANFNLLLNQRIDYFPRAVHEVWHEYDSHRDQLVVEPSIALHYPAATYFFVHKDSIALAADITLGLERMIADGSFEKLYQKFYGDEVRRSQLKDRHVIELRHPALPSLMPLERKALWHHE